MDTDIIENLKSLHTSEVDARNGYQEALDDAKGKGMTALFADMVALHRDNAEELARELTKADQIADEEGSFMTVVHKTIMDIRSLFNGLGQSVLPGLIDGEKRNISKYDDALKDAKTPPALAKLLSAQRGRIAQKIALMEADKAAGERTSA
jgi:uncharacterized protein (TIGR02284 family)